MVYKFSTINGLVNYLEDSGGNIISKLIAPEKAEEIVQSAREVWESQMYAGYNLCVDGNKFFTVLKEEKATKPTTPRKRTTRKKVEK